MTLYDLISIADGYEFSVNDKDYDTETYFYGIRGEESEDDWDKSLVELSKLLKVERIYSNGHISVNLAEVIESRINELEKADLFIYCDIDSIMDDIDNILAGNVSEEWMVKFVDTLKGE